MAGNMDPDSFRDSGRRAARRRIAFWAAAVLMLLLVPLIAMQFTDEVNWDITDFAVFGALLIGVGVTYELASRMTNSTAYKSAVGVALAAAFLLFWVNGAVGIIGSESNDINLLYFGLLALGGIATVFVRFQARAMAIVLFAMALTQVSIAVAAIIAGQGKIDPEWPRAIVGLTMFFSTLWVASAFLFRKATQEQSLAGEGSED